MAKKQATGATLTAYEAARLLGTSAAYLYTLIYTGKLPAEKVSGIWRVPVSAIEEKVRQRVALSSRKATNEHTSE